MSSQPQPAPLGVHFSLKETSYALKGDHHRHVEHMLRTVFIALGLVKNLPLQLIYRQKISGMLRSQRIAVRSTVKDNPLGVLFRVQPGDNGTSRELLVVLPQNPETYFDDISGTGKSATQAVFERLREKVDEARFESLAPEASVNEPGLAEAPSAEKIAQLIETRITHLDDEEVALIREIDLAENDRQQRISKLKESRGRVAADFPASVHAGIYTVLDQELGVLERELKEAKVRTQPVMARVESITRELDKLKRALLELRK